MDNSKKPFPLIEKPQSDCFNPWARVAVNLAPSACASWDPGEKHNPATNAALVNFTVEAIIQQGKFIEATFSPTFCRLSYNLL